MARPTFEFETTAQEVANALQSEIRGKSGASAGGYSTMIQLQLTLFDSSQSSSLARA